MDTSKFHPETPGAKLVDIMSFFKDVSRLNFDFVIIAR